MSIGWWWILFVCVNFVFSDKIILVRTGWDMPSFFFFFLLKIHNFFLSFLRVVGELYGEFSCMCTWTRVQLGIYKTSNTVPYREMVRFWFLGANDIRTLCLCLVVPNFVQEWILLCLVGVYMYRCSKRTWLDNNCSPPFVIILWRNNCITAFSIDFRHLLHYAPVLMEGMRDRIWH